MDNRKLRLLIRGNETFRGDDLRNFRQLPEAVCEGLGIGERGRMVRTASAFAGERSIGLKSNWSLVSRNEAPKATINVQAMMA